MIQKSTYCSLALLVLYSHWKWKKKRRIFVASSVTFLLKKSVHISSNCLINFCYFCIDFPVKVSFKQWTIIWYYYFFFLLSLFDVRFVTFCVYRWLMFLNFGLFLHTQIKYDCFVGFCQSYKTIDVCAAVLL